MKGSLIGFGTIAQGHLSAYLKSSKLSIAAVVDPSPERRQQAQQLIPNIKTFGSLDELFSEQRLDFIDICSPPNTHYEYISAGLSNDCHILCEKPFLLNGGQYADILNLMKCGDKVIYPCHNYKFSPILKLTKEIVSSEQFGQIVGGYFRTIRSGHAVGVSEWKPHWRRDSDISGGGILRDHGTHSIYIARQMCGKNPRAVSCITGCLHDDKFGTNEDTAMLTMYFDDNIQFAINLTWASSFRNSYYSIIGSKGNIIVEDDNLLLTTKEGGVSQQSLISEFNDSSHKSWFQDMLIDFTDVVENQNHQTQSALLEEAYITTVVVESAYLSSQQKGKLVELPDGLVF